MEAIDSGSMATCVACAVVLGADPVTAGILAGIVALVVRVGGPALLDWYRAVKLKRLLAGKVK